MSLKNVNNFTMFKTPIDNDGYILLKIFITRGKLFRKLSWFKEYLKDKLLIDSLKRRLYVSTNMWFFQFYGKEQNFQHFHKSQKLTVNPEKQIVILRYRILIEVLLSK